MGGEWLPCPALIDLVSSPTLGASQIFSGEGYTDSRLLVLGAFNSFFVDSEVSELTTNLLAIKPLDYIYHINYLNTVTVSNLHVSPLSYSQVLDLYRASHAENQTSTDLITNYSLGITEELPVLSNCEVRLRNPIKLRDTAKNSASVFKALQKVFRSRFEGSKSNLREHDLSITSVKHPDIFAPKVLYGPLLGKNKGVFFGSGTCKSYLNYNYNLSNTINNPLNSYFSDLPFFLSKYTQSSRYAWFGWQSRWSMIEVQPSSVVRFSLLEVPYKNKYSGYTSGASGLVKDNEIYLTRLSQARKNYISSWALRPYLYSRISNWYSFNGYLGQAFNDYSLDNLRVVLRWSKRYWAAIRVTIPSGINTIPFTDINTPGRSSWKPTSGLRALNYKLPVLSSILTKREYLYKEYFLNCGYTPNLSKSLIFKPVQGT